MIDEHDAEWLKNDRDYWMRRAKTAEGERDAWDENHQILSEHYQRMTERAAEAEARAAALWTTAKTLCRQRDVCNNAASEGWHRAFEYRERAEKAEADKPHAQADNR